MSDEGTVRTLRARLERGEILQREPVTEWARMLLLFAVDHPTGFKNLFKLGPASSPRDRIVALAHRLHTLAAVRNLVTHRASAGTATLGAFRASYYPTFEDLVALA